MFLDHFLDELPFFRCAEPLSEEAIPFHCETLSGCRSSIAPLDQIPHSDHAVLPVEEVTELPLRLEILENRDELLAERGCDRTSFEENRLEISLADVFEIYLHEAVLECFR